jgi:hypothetical protein
MAIFIRSFPFGDAQRDLFVFFELGHPAHAVNPLNQPF